MMKKEIICAVAMTVSISSMAQKMVYPVAPHDSTVDVYFGEKVADPYRPLENDNSKETTRWVQAEDKVCQDYFSKIPYRGKILARLKKLVNYEKVSVPSYNKYTGKWYFSKNDGLQNQSVIYVMDKLGDEKNAYVFLDPNKLSDDGTVALKGLSFSHDGKYCAYNISRSGSDWQEIYVLDAKTGKQLKDSVRWSKFSGAAWQGDGFFYSAYNKPEKEHAFSSENSGQKIYYHQVGTPQCMDQLFYENPAKPMRFYTTGINDEETMQILYESGAGAGSNLYIRNLKQSGSQFIQMTSNMDNIYQPIDFVGDKIYILTNDHAPKYKLMVADLHHPGINDWKTVIPEGNDVLESAAIVDAKLIITYMHDACDRAYIYSLEGQKMQEVKLPGYGTVSFSGDKDRKECFLSFASFTYPNTVYQYDIADNTFKVYACPKVNFPLKDYITEQVFYHSKDGTKIPMFLTYKKGLRLNGKNPVYLYGYGGFNISMPPHFSPAMLAFMEKGGIYAQANIRGGSEYGEKWHLAGIKMHKQNVFDDFIAAAEYLIDKKYTSKNYLAIVGGSNGGLLVGACETQRPDLFKVCVPEVGVMDMLRYHKFTIGWNWASDYGTSDDSKEMFEYLKNYSPLHNIRKGAEYPATLITTADHDDRVVPAHSFKFAATMQADNASNNPVLIRIDTKAGHGGGKPLLKQLEEIADIYSFIFYNMHLKY